MRIGTLDHVPLAYRGNCHFSRAAYGKVCLEGMSERTSGPLLIVDPDTIVEHDVAHLAAVEMGNRILGVVCGADAQAFNSGVMLVNLEAWHRHDVQTRLLLSWLNNPQVKNAEQDLLIRVMRPEWIQPLEPCWNILSHEWQPGTRGIIHCVGGRKPWHGDYRKNPEVQDRFYQHLDRTFLAGRREWHLTGSIKRRLNKYRICRNRAA